MHLQIRILFQQKCFSFLKEQASERKTYNYKDRAPILNEVSAKYGVTPTPGGII